MTLTGQLRKLDACSEAITWAQPYATLAEAWAVCARGDWMLWLIGRTIARNDTAARRRLVKVACQCARLALPYVKAGEDRPLKAIELAERWAAGDEAVTIQQLRNAADAAYAADAASAYAAYAAYAASADAASDYAADAAYAAYASASAYAADADARAQTLAKCADFVRAEFTAAEIEAVL